MPLPASLDETVNDNAPPRPRAGRNQRPGRRPLGHGDLQLVLLALIEQQPRHGYELIRLIAELFAGLYTPSAGTIYPTLTRMQQRGWIAAENGDSRKRYALTAAGQMLAEAERGAIDAALERTHHSARAIARASTPAPVREALRWVKRGLLARQGHWDDAEIRRVAALLHDLANALNAQR